MAALTRLQKRVKRLEQTFVLKHPVDLVVLMFFGLDDEPHGKYGMRKFHVHREYWPTPHSGYEAVPEREEIECLRRQWGENGHRLYAAEGSPEVSFEEFLRAHECKCLLHAKQVIVPIDNGRQLEGSSNRAC